DSHDYLFQAEDCIQVRNVTGVQTCALPISYFSLSASRPCSVSLSSPASARYSGVCVGSGVTRTPTPTPAARASTPATTIQGHRERPAHPVQRVRWELSHSCRGGLVRQELAPAEPLQMGPARVGLVRMAPARAGRAGTGRSVLWVPAVCPQRP